MWDSVPQNLVGRAELVSKDYEGSLLPLGQVKATRVHYQSTRIITGTFHKEQTLTFPFFAKAILHLTLVMAMMPKSLFKHD